MGFESFVNPSLLLGVSAAAVPIVLHLIMRQQPRLLEFPALRFVKQRQETNRRRLRLRHWILLALRMAALCLLALALARPSFKSSGGFVDREAPAAVALVFDTSPRMTYRDQNQSRLQVAQETSQWLLGELPPDSQVAVLESRLGAAVFQVDLGAAKQRIERLEPTATPQPLLKVLADAAELLKTSDLATKEIYIFSDLSQSAWVGDTAGKLLELLKELETVGIQVIDVGVEQPKNAALGEVRLISGQVLSKNSSLRLEVEVASRGLSEPRHVELFLGQSAGAGDAGPTAAPRGRQVANLSDGQSQMLDFRLGGLEEGTHQGWLRLVGADGLACDDVRYFTFEVKPAWSVLIAAPSPAEEYAFFLSQALAPEHFRKNDQARFLPETVTLEELDQLSLEKYAAVCLVDPAPLTAEVWRKLRDFAMAGGGVAIFLGRNAEPVESFNQSVAQELLPGELSQQARRPGGSLHLAPQSYDHPLLAKFRSKSGSIPWEGYPVFRYWQLDALHEDVGTIIPYSDASPALLERTVGQGRVLTMTTSVSDSANDPAAWNFLPTGSLEFEPWPFVVLVDGLGSYLVGSTEGQLNYYAGQTAVLHLEPGDETTSYLLSMPPRTLSTDGKPTAQTDEPLRRTVDLKLQSIVEAATERLGNYRCRAGGEQGGLDRGFSVNLLAEASNLTRIEEEGLKKVFGDVDFRLARSRDQIVRDISESRVGRELFPLLIVLVAVALGLEHVLANRFYKRT